MRCWEDARSGVEKEAVATCGLCGKGLCSDHAIGVEAPRAEGGRIGHVAWHAGAPMLILCPFCLEAVRKGD